MTKRLDLIATIGFLGLCLVFAVYSALMLDRSARKFDTYTALATKNHALIIENQAAGAENQKLFREHMKHDEEVRAGIKALLSIMEATARQKGQGR